MPCLFSLYSDSSISSDALKSDIHTSTRSTYTHAHHKAPELPKNFQGEANSPNTIQLKWDPPPNISGNNNNNNNKLSYCILIIVFSLLYFYYCISIIVFLLSYFYYCIFVIVFLLLYFCYRIFIIVFLYSILLS